MFDNKVIISGLSPVTGNTVTHTFTIRPWKDLFILDHFSVSGTIRECGRFATEAEAETRAHALVAEFGIVEK